jgi:iron complex outermembrane receptor protein
MHFLFSRNSHAVAMALTATSLTSVAVAQDSAPSSTAKLMEEIVVSARGIKEGLQDAPIAVSAFTGETLDYRGVDSLAQIERFVPSLTLQNNPSFGGASNSAAIYLRGVGQKEFLPTTEPGVGLYVDGVYVARSVGAILDIVDIDRLEVLRGPQGTLFGRNTIGGAISIATRKPQPGGEFEGNLAAAAGTDSLVHLRGTVHVPVSESVAVRASLASMTQDGYVDRADGIDLGNDDTFAGRVSLAFQPNDDFAALITADMTRDRENGPAMQLIGIDFTDLSQLQGVVLAPPPPMAFIHNVTTAAMGPGQPCAATDPAGNGVTYNPASPNCYDARYLGADGSNEGTAPAYSETDVFGISATLDYTLSENMAIKSITAYRELESDFARDGDHSPHRISQFEDTLDQEQLTQELQLLGTYDRMDWILGLYYFSEDGDNVNTLDFTVSNFRSGGAFDNTSWAAFAQATYDMTDRVHLTLGARYTDEDKAFTPDQIIYNNYFAGFSNLVPPGNPLAALDAPFLQAGSRILPLVEKEISISEFTPMANLAFDLSDNVMLYATYSEGFKSGGFTQRVFPPIVAGFTAPPGTPDIDLIPTYEPEFVEVLEAGFKMNLLDGQLRLNGAVFKTSYEELQVQVFNSVAPVTQNIGEASIEGFELELSASPAESWFIEGSLSLLNAEYDTIDTANTLIFESNEFERVPETTASLGLSKEFSISNAGTLLLRADWSYRSETFNDAYNTPLLETDSYSLIDASARWTNVDGDWTVILSGNNLSDEEYLVTGVYGTAFQSLEGVYNRGRQWRLEVRKSF